MSVAYSIVLACFFAIAIATPVDIISIGGKPDGLSNADTSQNCPAGYSQPANSNWPTCYKIFTNFKSKKLAAAQCRANNGTLASVPNSFVNSFLYYTATQISATSIWLGIECFNGDVNTCVNDDGTPFVFNNFYPGQPNVDGNCVYMSTIGRDAQQWLSFDCEQKFQFACEAAVGGATVIPTTTQVPAITTSKICPANYTQVQSMCYNFVYLNGDQISPNQASAKCSEVPGGLPATIPNAQVNSFVISSLKGNDMVAFGLVCPNIKFDGDRSSCYWIDGTPFGYNAFEDGYPKPSFGNGCCDFLNGSWEDCFDCSGAQFGGHICQAPMQ